jgi:hypothetical protein
MSASNNQTNVMQYCSLCNKLRLKAEVIFLLKTVISFVWTKLITGVSKFMPQGQSVSLSC